MNLDSIQAVAFDLDGTLVDSIPDLAAAANAMREHLQLPPLEEVRIQSHVGDGIASLVHRVLTDDRDGQAHNQLWEKAFTFFVQYYREHIADLTCAYPGVVDGLALLRALKLPLVVITNKSERLAIPLLQELELFGQFSMVIGGDTLAEKKPSALPLQHVCQVLNIDTANLLMVGDSRNDILAARNAGSPVAAVSYGYEEVEHLGADVVINSLAELYDLIKNRTHAS